MENLGITHKPKIQQRRHSSAESPRQTQPGYFSTLSTRRGKFNHTGQISAADILYRRSLWIQYLLKTIMARPYEQCQGSLCDGQTSPTNNYSTITPWLRYYVTLNALQTTLELFFRWNTMISFIIKTHHFKTIIITIPSIIPLLQSLYHHDSSL